MAILALIALGGFSMCGKNEVVAHEEDPWIDLCGDQPIRFSSSMATPATKTTSPLPNNTTFGVMAWYTGQNDWSASASPNFMYNEDVLFDGSTYTYAPIKYWPNNPGDKVTFWAYSPHDASGLTLKSGESPYGNTSTGLPSLDFNVLTGSGSVDLMVADFEDDDTSEYWTVNHTKPSLDSKVNFLFRHILCKIDFRVQKAETVAPSTVIKLKSISFRQLYLTGTHPGTYNYSWDVTGDRGTGIAWSDDNGHVLPAYSTDPVDLANSYVATYMPIPQELGDLEDEETARVLLHVEYSVGSSSGTTGADYPLYLALHEDNEWKQNTYYTYTLRISPSDTYIEFSAAIVPWVDNNPWVYHHVE